MPAARIAELGVAVLNRIAGDTSTRVAYVSSGHGGDGTLEVSGVQADLALDRIQAILGARACNVPHASLATDRPAVMDTPTRKASAEREERERQEALVCAAKCCVIIMQ